MVSMHCSRVSKEHDGVPLASITKYMAHHGYERADWADAAVSLNSATARDSMVRIGQRIGASDEFDWTADVLS
jgi:hypothetical protein